MNKLLFILSLLTLILSIVLCYWLGEGFYNFLNLIVILIILLGSLIISIFMPLKRKTYSSFFFIILLSVLFSINYLGNLKARFAYNDCILRGEEVRNELLKYYNTNKHYPLYLNELVNYKLPGNRILRSNLLNYESNGSSSYKIYFSDNFVINEASNINSFISNK
jgi:hypothetical protein